MHASEEVLENQIWIGVTWREAFVVPFIPGTVPGWSDACFSAVEWPRAGGSSAAPPRADGDQGWCVARSPATDGDGWVYGTAFDHLREDRPGGRASKRANDRVRSRLWVRGPSEEGPPAAGGWQQQQADGAASSISRAVTAPAPAAGADASASASASAAGKAALAGAAQVAQQAVPGAVKRASFAGMLNTFLKLVKDAAARHNTAMITPDITGWFFVISSHTEQLKRQQLGQLPHLVWFAHQQQLPAPMQPAGLGSNTAGVVLKGADAALAATAAAAAAAAAAGGDNSGQGGGASSSSGSRKQVLNASGQLSLPGRPFDGTILQLGGSSSSNSKAARSGSGQPPRPSAAQQQQGAASGAAPASATAAPAAGSAGLQLHVAALEMLDQLLAGAQYSQAAYGYVAAAGHLHSLTSAFKMFAALPHFNAITGASLEAHIRALHTLAGIAAEDVLLAAWHNDTFRPCHYVAVDAKRGCIVLGIRGSLELGDLETDITAASLPFEFQGVAGWVHEGLLAAAAYVVSNTVDALAAAAERCPGWPLVVSGHSLGGGVAALVTLLLQQPGAAPPGLSGIRCVAIGPAAVLSEELCSLCEQYVTSVIVGADAIPRLSTFSVESLLLELVNSSVSRRVTSQLAATTSSVAASTAGAINSLAAGLTRLANTATNNVVSNVNNMKTSLASFSTGLPTIPLMDGGLGGSFFGLPGLTGDSSWAHQLALYTTGTGSLELTRLVQQQQQQQQQQQGGASGLREGSDGGLKQLHAMLQKERQQQQTEETRRASMEQQQPPALTPAAAQQADAGVVHVPASAMAAAAAAAAAAAGSADADAASPAHAAPASLPKLGKLPASGLTRPLTAATAQSVEAAADDADAAAAASMHPQQQHTPTAAAAQPPANPTAAMGQPGSATKPPGGAKLMSGGAAGAASPMMIFSRVDDARIISGIQAACAELQQAGAAAGPAPVPAAAAATGSGSGAGVAGAGDAARASGQRGSQGSSSSIRAASLGRPKSSGSGSSSSRRSRRVSAFAIESAREEAAAGSTSGAGSSRSSSRGRGIQRSTSEPSLQQWASDGLEPLGEPSWARLSRDGSAEGGQAGAQVGDSTGSGGMGAVGDSTVQALESDLKRTARLYPPGRILWVLSEELVGPAAHQLMSAVAAHLQQPAASSSSSSSSRVDSAKQARPPKAAAGSRSQASGKSHLEPPLQAEMDMPASIMSSSKQQQQQPQSKPPPHKRGGGGGGAAAAAADTTTAHAVAAASAAHILHDVHSVDARRAAAAALHAAQHVHPPLQLGSQHSPEQAAAQLQRQQQQQAEDMQAGNAAVAPALADKHAAPAAAGSGHASGIPAAAGADKQKQKPLRTLATPPSAVQMTVPASSTGAAAAPRHAPTGRSSSGPMEVDGSAAARAAWYDWPAVWAAAASSQDLPEELRELIDILGSPCDAASALAIGYKKQLLLQHFWQQRRHDAAVEAAAAAAAAAGAPSGGGGRPQGLTSSGRRSSSDSHLLRFEDMVAAVDDAAARAAGQQQASAAAVQQHLELAQTDMAPGVTGRASSSSSGKGSQGAEAVAAPPPATAQAAASARAAAAAVTAAAGVGHSSSSSSSTRHNRGHSWSPASHTATAAAAAAADDDGSGDELDMWSLKDVLLSPHTQPPVQAGAAASAEPSSRQQRHVEALGAPADDAHVRWAVQAATLHKQVEQQRQQQQQQSSLQELAAESLVELAQLPDRIVESLGALRLRGPGASPEGAGADAASLAALCAPVMGPASGSGGAGADGNSPQGLMPCRLPPVVVMPERDVFSRLLLHRSAMIDHLPSSYVRVLGELRESYQQLPGQLAQGQQQQP